MISKTHLLTVRTLDVGEELFLSAATELECESRSTDLIHQVALMVSHLKISQTFLRHLANLKNKIRDTISKFFLRPRHSKE